MKSLEKSQENIDILDIQSKILKIFVVQLKLTSSISFVSNVIFIQIDVLVITGLSECSGSKLNMSQSSLTIARELATKGQAYLFTLQEFSKTIWTYLSGLFLVKYNIKYKANLPCVSFSKSFLGSYTFLIPSIL